MNNQTYSTSYNTYQINPAQARMIRNQLNQLRNDCREASNGAQRARKPERVAELTAKASELQTLIDAKEATLKVAPPVPMAPELAVEMMIGHIVEDIAVSQKRIDDEINNYMRHRDALRILDDHLIKYSVRNEVYMNTLIKLEAKLVNLENQGVEVDPTEVANVLANIIEQVQERILWDAGSGTSYSPMETLKERFKLEFMAKFVQDTKVRRVTKAAECAEVWLWLVQEDALPYC